MLKVKRQGENLESRKRKTTNYSQELRLTADFSAEIAEARKQTNILKLLKTNQKPPKIKQKNLSPKILYPSKLSFKN